MYSAYTYEFFTIWFITLLLLENYTNKYINLLFLSSIVLICGSYISFINPKYYIIKDFNNNKFKIDKHNRLLIDIFLHFLPFMYCLKKYNNNNNIRNSLYVVFFYLINYNPIIIYNLSK